MKLHLIINNTENLTITVTEAEIVISYYLNRILNIKERALRVTGKVNNTMVNVYLRCNLTDKTYLYNQLNKNLNPNSDDCITLRVNCNLVEEKLAKYLNIIKPDKNITPITWLTNEIKQWNNSTYNEVGCATTDMSIHEDIEPHMTSVQYCFYPCVIPMDFVESHKTCNINLEKQH